MLHNSNLHKLNVQDPLLVKVHHGVRAILCIVPCGVTETYYYTCISTSK